MVNPDGDLFRGQTTTTLTAVGGDGEVTLTYTARAADIVSGHTNEWRYRHAEANDNFPAWATPTTADLAATNTHSVTGLVNGRTYKFQAQAVTSAGVEIVGSRAPEATATPNDPPAPPVITSAVGGAGTITLTWTWEPNAAGTEPTHFQYLAAAPGPLIDWTTIPGGASVRTYTVPNLVTGDDYVFRMRAFAGTVASSLSLRAVPTEPASNAPITEQPNTPNLSLIHI